MAKRQCQFAPRSLTPEHGTSGHAATTLQQKFGWDGLEDSVVRCLNRQGIQSVNAFDHLSPADLHAVLQASPTLRKNYWVIQIARALRHGIPSATTASGPTTDLASRTVALLGKGPSSRPRDVIQSLAIEVPFTPSHPDGPPPSAVRSALQAASNGGVNIAAILDEVALGRSHAALKDSSSATYASHFRSICAFCKLLDASPLPASLVTIRRIAGCMHTQYS